MKTLLHVGCGADRINRTTLGFNDGSWKEVRLDINELNQPDVIGSIRICQGLTQSLLMLSFQVTT
jgi:hypothetical protein